MASSRTSSLSRSTCSGLSGLLDADPRRQSLVDELSPNVRAGTRKTRAELAHTIYPPLLEGRGLASALRSAADSAG